ncbi:MAG: VCBS repeat-containing protein, partial [Bacteroidales bacterium]|nr:VCBS repeat-containing protein [Bacteroidales bacterium]
MKKGLLFAAAMLVLYGVMMSQTAVQPSGSGTTEDPYQVGTLDNLYWITQNSGSWNKHFIQTADIDATATSGWNGGAGFASIGFGSVAHVFQGSYDGRYHTIDGLTINRPDSLFVGFFGSVGANAVIKNLGLTSTMITGYDYVGGLAGGVVSGNNDTVISNCFAEGTVSARSIAGGLAGYITQSLLVNCYSGGTVTTTSGSAGGLVGVTYISAEIHKSYSTANVTGETNAGGLVARNENNCRIRNCYSTGSVSGYDRIGGLAGISKTGSEIYHSYSIGFITGTINTGGFLGVNESATVTGCFWDTQTSGQSTSAGGTGKPTLAMKTTSNYTYVGWDFAYEYANGTDDYWVIEAPANNGYPILCCWMLAAVETSDVINITGNSAESGGDVTGEGLWSSVTAKGVVWGTAVFPTIQFCEGFTTDGSGTGSFSSSLMGLAGGTVYYARAYATNSTGTAYGEQKSFQTEFLPPGNALDFDGTDDYVDCGNGPVITGSAPRTIEAWAYARVFNHGGIFQAGATGTNNGDFSLRTYNTDETWRINLWGSADIDIELPGSKDAWHHYCLIYDGTHVKLYYDGNLVVDQTGTISTLSYNFRIGIWQVYEFNGIIDEVRVWNTARTQQEVRENMNLTVDETSPNLIAYYRFDQTEGTLLPDLTINGYDGTLYNMDNSDWVAAGWPYGMPYVTTAALSGFTCQALAGGGDVISEGTSPVSAKGLLWDTTTNPVLGSCLGYTNEGTGPGSFVSNATGLSEGTTYYFRAYAINSTDTGYGEILSYTTGIQAPTKALNFDGVNDYVSIPNEAAFDFTNSMTVEAWIRVDSFTKTWQAIITKGDNSWRIQRYNNTGYICFDTDGTGIQQLISNTNMNDGLWHHIAAVYDGTAKYLYVDGRLDNMIATTGNIDNNNYPVLLGENAQQTGRQFDGKMDELRIWNTALDSITIREHIHLSLQGNEAGLVAYWQFNEYLGTVLHDFLNNHHGTLVNMSVPNCWVQSTIPIGGGISNTQSETNGAVDFTGTQVSMYYYSQNNASVTVTRVDTFPNIFPVTGADTIFTQKYWAINRYGNGSFNADLQFSVNGFFDPSFENNPDGILLYSRPANSDEGWMPVEIADSVNSGQNFAVFENISSFCQYVIAKVYQPEILVAPLTLDFGEVVIGDSASITLNICNTGTKTLTVSGILCSNPCFIPEIDSCTILPGNNMDIGVKFRPQHESAYNSTLTLYSNDPDESITELNLFGTGVRPYTALLKLPFSYNLITNNFNSIDVGVYAAPHFTDLDNDRLLDLLIGNQNGTLTHYRQQSENSLVFDFVTGNFSSIVVGLYATPCVTDIDNDGLLDLIVGTHSGKLYHYKQHSRYSLTFDLITNYFNSIDVGDKPTPCFTDIDGNGLLDLIIGNSAGYLVHYEQQSENSLLFSFVTNSFNSIDVGTYASPFFTDLDGDRCLDLIIGDNYGRLSHYKQQSENSVVFSLSTNSLLSMFIGSYLIPYIIDLDGDRLLDVIFGEYNGNLNHYEQCSIDSLAFANSLIGNPLIQSYLLKGNHIPGDIELNCSDSAFQVSLSENSGFSQNLIIPCQNNSVSDTIFVRFTPHLVKDYTENIMHASTGTDTVYLMLSGNGIKIDNFPGNTLDFDGFDDYVDCGQGIPVTGDQARTIEMWAYAETFNGGGIFQAGQAGGTLGDFSLSATETDNLWRIHLGGNDIDVSLPGSKDKWHHYCLTYNDSITRLYYDGALVARIDTALNTGAHDVFIGRWENFYFDGRIEEVRIWNTERDSIQIRENMHLDLTGLEPGLSGYWQFNENSGNILPNFQDSNNGILHNMDNGDWIASTIPFGHGQANSKTEATGSVDFTGTGFSAFYTAQSGASVTAVRIDTLPNIIPHIDVDTVFERQYWVVNRYGSGGFEADLRFKTSEDLTAGDESNPGNIKLFSRQSTSDGDWVLLKTADSVSAGMDYAVFKGITGFSQFMLGKAFAAEISILPLCLYFGEVTIGDSATLVFNISNIGSDTLLVSGIVSNHPDFTVGQASCTLLPGENILINVGFKPQMALDYYNALTVYSNDTDEPVTTVNLIGEGKLPSVVMLEFPHSFSLITDDFNSMSIQFRSAPCFTDFDNDGLIDLIIGEKNGNLWHYEQQSLHSEVFSYITSNFNSIDVGSYSAPCFTDLDSDGLLDLIIGDYYGNLHHYKQQSLNSSSFVPVSEQFCAIDVGAFAYVSITDLDGDGALDMIIGEDNGNLNHYEQDSLFAFSFSLVTENFNSIDVGDKSSPHFTDFEGDGLIDLIIGEYYGTMKHYKQQAPYSTSFSLVSDSFCSIDVGWFPTPVFNDFNKDGLLDLITGEYYGSLLYYEQAGIDTLSFEPLLTGKTATRRYYLKCDHLRGDLELFTTDSIFKISQSENGPFSQHLLITPADHRIADTVYVKCSPVTEKIYYSNVYHITADLDTVVLVLHNECIHADNYPGNTLDFDGSNDYVNCGTGAQITGNQARTIEAWAYTRAFNNGGIFQAGQTGLSNKDFSLRTTIIANTWRMQFWGSDLDVTLPNSLNAWHHYCLTYDGSAARLYYDGKFIAQKDVVLNTGQNDICIGRWENSYFDGKIDEVRIWDRALDSLEIRENMHLNVPGLKTGLIGYWQFNEANGIILSDIAGDNDGQLINMDVSDWVVSTIPFGGGLANSQTETAGSIDFTGTGLAMFFNTQNGAAITVSRIDTVPNLNPVLPETVFDLQYWVINRYGTGNYNADITFTADENLTTGDQNNPADISLYWRGNTADTDWVYLASAGSVNASTDQATFAGVTVAGQFIIAR